MSATSEHPLKIAVNAQVVPHSGGGGFETVLAGLIKSLGKLTDGPEQYTIIGRGDAPECWEPYVGPNQRIVRGPIQPQLVAPKRESLKRALGPLRRPATKVTRWMFPLPPPSLWRDVPISDGFYEGLGCNVIHFPYHDFVFCAMPS